MDKVEDGALARIEARYRDLVGSGNPIAQGAPARTKLPLEDRIAMRMSGITRTLTALRGGGELADYDDEWDNDVSYALEFLTEAAAEITSLRSELARKEEALRECEEHFDQRADADQPAGCDSPIPNDEMTMLIKVRAAIQASSSEVQS